MTTWPVPYEVRATANRTVVAMAVSTVEGLNSRYTWNLGLRIRTPASATRGSKIRNTAKVSKSRRPMMWAQTMDTTPAASKPQPRLVNRCLGSRSTSAIRTA
ncbi:hypothetical protein Pure05_07780 [Paenarthrobacter ureafaciens]|nr:hypothetical protein Pure01_06050 [Paenarthrobacter ureafaciens]GLU62531.1 hypothetical protein Pure02_07810 [Paenarthrobacter ureafaciens]GLU66981.1 hypothetical protein Pure03_09570 [Paenarthrobacter ureafaciens]GLU70717.1 hypothetical protein Pure04_04320 [Paenarthrobacter ureafaciens]GLU75338.1 hypothetical protein Pure05_07780 [Paenarthrobacter ureafaciens]